MKPSNLEKFEELTEDLTLTQMIEKVSSRLLLNAKQLVELIRHIPFISIEQMANFKIIFRFQKNFVEMFSI